MKNFFDSALKDLSSYITDHANLAKIAETARPATQEDELTPEHNRLSNVLE
jgi:hypothetical protein